MPTKKKATGSKRYVLQNPRNIPKGTRIAREGGTEFGEGQTFSGDNLSDETLKAWLARGQIREA
tara:strand:- start:1404 stop:1595 length:192 start_codon:yes stop_codon:yes gene_type:complete